MFYTKFQVFKLRRSKEEDFRLFFNAFLWPRAKTTQAGTHTKFQVPGPGGSEEHLLLFSFVFL